MKVTAMSVMITPTMILSVRDSPKKMVPTAIAVTGSKTPRTDVLVAPMILVDQCREYGQTYEIHPAEPAMDSAEKFTTGKSIVENEEDRADSKGIECQDVAGNRAETAAAVHDHEVHGVCQS